MDGVQLLQGYTATMRRYFFVPLSFQKFLVLIRSISEGWKDGMALKPSSGFKIVYQPSYYQIQIKVTIRQTDSIMTFNFELCESQFSVLSGRFTIKLSKICFLCTYLDQIIIQQKLMFCSKFSFTIFLLIIISIIFKSFHKHCKDLWTT